MSGTIHNQKKNPVLRSDDPYQYHLETIISTISASNYSIEQKSRRWAKIFFMGKTGDLYRFQLLGLETEYYPGPEYNLRKKVARLFSDLRISMNEKGKITRLHNLKKIQERWELKRRELKKHNQGSSVENYFNSVTVLLEDEQKTIKYLFDYYRYGMFFNGTVLGSLTDDIEHRRRTGILDNLEESEVEEVWHKQKTEQKGESVFTVSSSDTSKENELTLYKGTFFYKNNQLSDGFIEIRFKHFKIKHSILWVG